jgi:hypothetical protein
MSWATKRIREYQRGDEATFIERRNLEHGNPVLFTLLLIAISVGVYGIWMHDWTLILIAATIAMLGHIYVWLAK